MPIAQLADAFIGYDVLGHGETTVVYAVGGRYTADRGRALADALRGDFTVVVYDRRNAGRSSAYLGREVETVVDADDVAGLIRHLGLEHAHVVGGGGGARTAIAAARRHPHVVSSIAVWWIIGGDFGLVTMATRYVQSLLQAVRAGGMEQVARLPELANVVANPVNEQYLLGLDPDEVVANLYHWLDDWLPRADRVTSGMTAAELSEITTPTLVFEQYDDYHPEEVARNITAAMPNASLVAPPPSLGPGRFWMRLGESTHDPRVDSLIDWRDLAPQIRDFIHDADRQTR